MSDLVNIYDALAAMPVTIEGAVVTAYAPRNMPASVPTGNLPVRILLPLGTRSGANAVSQQSMARQNVTVTCEWRCVDLFLYKPGSQGRVSDNAGALVQYQAAYVDAIKYYHHLTKTALIEAVAMDVGIYEYPAGSKEQYFGVQVTVTIKEIA